MSRALLVWLGVALVACTSRELTSSRGFSAMRPSKATSCYANPGVAVKEGLPLEGDLVLRQNERGHKISCLAGDVMYGAVVVDGLDPSVTARERIQMYDVGTATAEPTWSDAHLSGVPATEQRAEIVISGPRVRVLRFVQKGDSLYYASAIFSPETEGAAQPAVQGWFDGVKFADLESPP